MWWYYLKVEIVVKLKKAGGFYGLGDIVSISKQHCSNYTVEINEYSDVLISIITQY